MSSSNLAVSRLDINQESRVVHPPVPGFSLLTILPPMSLGALATWFVGSAAGPFAVEKVIEGLLVRGDWSKRLVDDLSRDGRLSRSQRRLLAEWLNDVKVVDLLIDRDRAGLETALDRVTAALDVPPQQAEWIVDGVVGRFLQYLEPSTAIAIAEYQRTHEGDLLREQVTRLREAVEAARLPPWTVRSTYRRIVEQIPPPVLLGRLGELTELGRFAVADDGPAYQWWQAGAWAGKSALMAVFALNPPVGVDVVSFFVTRRFAGQSDCSAFLAAVIDQAAALVNDPSTSAAAPIAALSDGIAYAQALDLLTRAAEKSQREGRRLVLLVDGLDEDSGLSGSLPHSIAALLPQRPSAGLKVIVAGRPNPPVPIDVPGGHPLRDPGIVRRLESSDAADATRLAALHEIDHLVSGSELEQDVLGLLVAAGGGLTAADLAVLTGPSTLRPVERILTGAHGRTFTTRPPQWDQGLPEVESVTYLVGHEQIRSLALKYLADKMADYRGRIDTWADNLAVEGWPAQTPEYLLGGYPSMLAERSGAAEVERLVQLTLDERRRARMLAVIGGDSVALAGIARALEAISRQPEPDVRSALALSRMRDRLRESNEEVPEGLPAVWARLGQPGRADFLARSITDADARDRAALALLRPLKDSGRYADAQRIIAEAEEHALADPYPDSRREGLLRLVAALAAAGEQEASRRVAAAAEQAAAETVDQVDRALAHLRLAEVLERAGEQDLGRRARQAGVRAAMSPVPPLGSLNTTFELVQTLAGIREYEAAEAVAATGEDQIDVDHFLVALFRGSCANGDVDRAEQVVVRIADPDSRDPALVDLIDTLIEAGQDESAQRVLELFHDPLSRVKALAVWLAHVPAGSGAGPAGDVADAATRAALSIDDPSMRSWALSNLTIALGSDGDRDRMRELIVHLEQAAEELTHLAELDETGELADPAEVAEARSRLAVALGAGGEPARADEQLAAAQDLVVTLDDEMSRLRQLAILTQAFAWLGREPDLRRTVDAAKQVCLGLADVYQRQWELRLLCDQLINLGAYEPAAAVVSVLPNWAERAELWNRLVTTALAFHEHELVEQLLGHIAEPRTRAEAMTLLADALLDIGRDAQARRLAGSAEQVARSGASPEAQSGDLVDLVRALTALQDLGRAEQVAAAVRPPHSRAEAFLVVARGLFVDGQRDRSLEAIATVRQFTDQVGTTEDYSLLFIELMGVLVILGEYDEAENLTRRGLLDTTRWSALFWLIRSLAERGESGRVGRLVAEARHLAETTTSPVFQAKWLSELSGWYASEGKYDEAEALARSIREPNDQATALTALIRELAVQDRLTDARELADSFAMSFHRDAALADLVAVLVVQGDDEQAERTALSVIDPDHRQRVLVMLARALIDHGRHERVDELIGRLTDPAYVAPVLIDLASAHFTGDHTDEARKVAAAAEEASLTIFDPERRASVLIDLVGILGHADSARSVGRIVAAVEQVSSSLPPPNDEVAILLRLTRALARAGHRDLAYATAEKVERASDRPENEYVRADTLASLAEVVGALGRPRAARRLLVLATAAGPWRNDLMAVARVAPSDLRSFADDVIRF